MEEDARCGFFLPFHPSRGSFWPEELYGRSFGFFRGGSETVRGTGENVEFSMILSIFPSVKRVHRVRMVFLGTS